MVEIISGHSLGSIGIDDNAHIWDECPSCGNQKIAESRLCQACHNREKVRRKHEIRALARNLTKRVLQGEVFILEPGPGVDFRQAIKVMVAAIVTKYSYTE